MKIIITQREIENAIAEYILSQVGTDDETVITIDFTTTRKPKSISAEINVRSANEPEEEIPEVKEKPKAQASQAAPKPVAVSNDGTVAAPKRRGRPPKNAQAAPAPAPVAAEAAEAPKVAEPVTEDEVVVNEDNAPGPNPYGDNDEELVEANNDVVEAQEETLAPAPATQRPSLFGNLSRPTN